MGKHSYLINKYLEVLLEIQKVTYRPNFYTFNKSSPIFCLNIFLCGDRYYEYGGEILFQSSCQISKAFLIGSDPMLRSYREKYPC